MAITTDMIKKLRETTGAGVLDCKNALQDAGEDIEKARDILREKGLAMAAKRSGRRASEGVLELYNHGDGRVGVMVEINCETDFVGRSDAFRKFAHEIALQIAAASPYYVREEDIPAEALVKEEQIATAKAKEEGKPDKIIPRIVEGYIKKYKEEFVLLNQAYIRDDSLSIQDVLNENIASIGENIIIRRFERWALGEGNKEEEETKE